MSQPAHRTGAFRAARMVTDAHVGIGLAAKSASKAMPRQANDAAMAEGTAPLIDWESIGYRVMYDAELLDVVMEQFTITMEKQLALLTKLLHDNAIESIRREAHKIKGAAANIGARRLQDFTERLETDATAENAAALTSAVAALAQTWHHLNEYLQSERAQADRRMAWYRAQS